MEFERTGNTLTSKEDEILNIHISEAQKQLDRDPKSANAMNHGNIIYSTNEFNFINTLEINI